MGDAKRTPPIAAARRRRRMTTGADPLWDTRGP